jgi:glyoxylase-like metal-dependent hydrolase (beta-lactamase superfamily II)
MEIKTVKVGSFRTNCYIIKKENNIIVIDPGDEYEKIKKEIDENISAILVTHNHFDHVGAINQFKNIKIYDYKNLKEQIYKIDDFEFEVIYTKGHTDDSISFYFEKEKVIFTGDFVFKNSIGRTDLETSSNEEMQKSIEKLKKYPKDITIYPGHGKETTLEEEIKTNPFFI